MLLSVWTAPPLSQGTEGAIRCNNSYYCGLISTNIPSNCANTSIKPMALENGDLCSQTNSNCHQSTLNQSVSHLLHHKQADSTKLWPSQKFPIQPNSEEQLKHLLVNSHRTTFKTQESQNQMQTVADTSKASESTYKSKSCLSYLNSAQFISMSLILCLCLLTINVQSTPPVVKASSIHSFDSTTGGGSRISTASSHRARTSSLGGGGPRKTSTYDFRSAGATASGSGSGGAGGGVGGSSLLNEGGYQRVRPLLPPPPSRLSSLYRGSAQQSARSRYDPSGLSSRRGYRFNERQQTRAGGEGDYMDRMGRKDYGSFRGGIQQPGSRMYSEYSEGNIFEHQGPISKSSHFTDKNNQLKHFPGQLVNRKGGRYIVIKVESGATTFQKYNPQNKNHQMLANTYSLLKGQGDKETILDNMVALSSTFDTSTEAAERVASQSGRKATSKSSTFGPDSSNWFTRSERRFPPRRYFDLGQLYQDQPKFQQPMGQTDYLSIRAQGRKEAFEKMRVSQAKRAAEGDLTSTDLALQGELLRVQALKYGTVDYQSLQSSHPTIKIQQSQLRPQPRPQAESYLDRTYIEPQSRPQPRLQPRPQTGRRYLDRPYIQPQPSQPQPSQPAPTFQPQPIQPLPTFQPLPRFSQAPLVDYRVQQQQQFAQRQAEQRVMQHRALLDEERRGAEEERTRLIMERDQAQAQAQRLWYQQQQAYLQQADAYVAPTPGIQPHAIVELPEFIYRTQVTPAVRPAVTPAVRPAIVPAVRPAVTPAIVPLVDATEARPMGMGMGMGLGMGMGMGLGAAPPVDLRPLPQVEPRALPLPEPRAVRSRRRVPPPPPRMEQLKQFAPRQRVRVVVPSRETQQLRTKTKTKTTTRYFQVRQQPRERVVVPSGRKDVSYGEWKTVESSSRRSSRASRYEEPSRRQRTFYSDDHEPTSRPSSRYYSRSTDGEYGTDRRPVPSTRSFYQERPSTSRVEVVYGDEITVVPSSRRNYRSIQSRGYRQSGASYEQPSSGRSGNSRPRRSRRSSRSAERWPVGGGPQSSRSGEPVTAGEVERRRGRQQEGYDSDFSDPYN